MRAIMNGVTVAESDQTVFLEGNHYFPRDSVRDDVLEASKLRTLCFWKGAARYYHAVIDGHRQSNAAWSYTRPYPWVRRIKGHIAFSPGVEVTP